MSSYKSIVVLDLESSGLPSFGKPKITELSVVGALIEHVEESHKQGQDLPRVLQKLNLCFYPQKRIDFEATEITGLDNALLEHIPTFNKEACQMIISFLNRLPGPICLVAHNGMKFDFQLLKAELISKQEDLPEGIYCADSLNAFRDIYPISPSITPLDMESISSCTNDEKSVGGTTILNEDEDIYNALTQTENMSEIQRANETTPKQQKRPSGPPPLKRKFQALNDENCNGRGNVAKKRLFRREKLISHKLVDLYRHVQGKDQSNCHNAENDSLALLECIVSSAPKFLAWMESHKVKFSQIPSMW